MQNLSVWSCTGVHCLVLGTDIWCQKSTYFPFLDNWAVSQLPLGAMHGGIREPEPERKWGPRKILTPLLHLPSAARRVMGWLLHWMYTSVLVTIAVNSHLKLKSESSRHMNTVACSSQFDFLTQFLKCLSQWIAVKWTRVKHCESSFNRYILVTAVDLSFDGVSHRKGNNATQRLYMGIENHCYAKQLETGGGDWCLGRCASEILR